jgi:heme-degrading monooxygenase HmoA
MVSKHIVELVKWTALGDVTDAQMVDAVNQLLPDLKTLPGFVKQELYKDDDGQWVDLYIWDTKENALASNDLMAPKSSFAALMSLIEPSSVAIEFLTLP